MIKSVKSTTYTKSGVFDSLCHTVVRTLGITAWLDGGGGGGGGLKESMFKLFFWEQLSKNFVPVRQTVKP